MNINTQASVQQENHSASEVYEPYSFQVTTETFGLNEFADVNPLQHC